MYFNFIGVENLCSSDGIGGCLICLKWKVCLVCFIFNMLEIGFLLYCSVIILLFGVYSLIFSGICSGCFFF